MVKRIREHIIGDIGETSSSLIFKQWGWTSDKITSDYGEDLDCQVFINNLKTHYHFRCQVKSTEKNKNFIRKLKNGDFSVSIEIEIAKSWLLAYYPVFLIIYDESLENHYWINASSYLKKNVNRLNRDSISFRISIQNSLRESKDKFLTEIKNYYQNIFRIDSSILSTNIYPIVMPYYLSLGMNLFKYKPKSEYFNIEPISEHVKKLPSWFLNIETLNPPYIFYLNLSAKEENIEVFINQISSLINSWNIEIKKNEWLSFIISPIQLKTSSVTEFENEFWNKDITDWFSFSKINNNVVNDIQYAFNPPIGFFSQVARKAASYETFHHINPKDDVAIELFSSIKTPYSYKYETSMYLKQIDAQFIPWKIKLEDEKRLLDQLPDDLKFSRVEGVKSIAGYLRGIISTSLFNPNLGLMNAITKWDDLQKDSVRNKIRVLSNKNEIVGNEDEQDISQLIYSFFEDLSNVGEQIKISEKDRIDGYPLDLSERMVFVQRYRIIKGMDMDIIDKKLGLALDELKSREDFLEIHSGYQEIDEYAPDSPVYRIFFQWKPIIEDSSIDSYEKIKNFILKTFDQIFPRKKKDKADYDTYDILRFLGQLYFEEIK